MIASNTPLKDFIHIERGMIPSNMCDHIVHNIEQKDWSSHEWDTHSGESFSHQTKELDILYAENDDCNLLYPIVQQACINYQDRYVGDQFPIAGGLGGLRFNRYGPNQIMRTHIDHIHSLFDGEQRGIPVLSVIGNLNDNYKGANLTFWDNYTAYLEKGDIIVWPSLFLFPHRVTETTENTRYSFVCWAF